LTHPIVQAPLAGGPSTPALAAAVSGAGGLGFLAAGYRTPEQLRADIAGARELTDAPIAVNLFQLAEEPVDVDALRHYGASLGPEADRRGVELGEPLFDDDWLAEKLAIVCQERVPIVSFTFGCPARETVRQLHEHDIGVWVTVTDPGEAAQAAEHEADALVVQGVEAGGHRASFNDIDGTGEIGVLALLRLVQQGTGVALVASGGIADGAGVAAVLAAGARAAQIGTAFMRCPEAGTSDVHRQALARTGPTRLTRAFTGRRARGIVNSFMREHDREAPAAYPHVHHLTAPLRAAARAAGDAGSVNLWAGQAHPLATERPAAELVRRWSEDARAALEQARQELEHP
jgi:nitronate monooxygenase